ncbi:MAG: peptidase MA family metallohydrolase [Candidatus Zhuqueibacterota bacterium]
MIIAALSFGALAQPATYNHPELDWLTIDTKHFQVHYHKGAERTAGIVAKIAEEIYWPVTSLYLYEPDGKVHFIIRDHDDYSNGGAYYYDNKVEIWASPMDFVLRGNHNWLRNVVTHEFVHMISLGASRKITRTIPAFYFQYMDYEPEKNPYVLYGFPHKIASYPLAMTTVPNWLAEGVAQYQLPKLDYDNWDSHRDMILRMSVLENTMLSFKEMGVFGKNSLDNEKVYNHGFSLVQYMAENYGLETLRRVFREMRKPLRFTANGALKSTIGKNEQQLYDEWKSYLLDMYTFRTRAIKEHQIAGKIIVRQGSANLYPTWSPDGKKFAFVSNRGNDYLSQSSLYIFNSFSGETKKISISGAVSSSVSWSNNGEKLVYSRRSRPTKNGSHFYDIYTYDLKQHVERQITRNFRAQTPDWSPDGQKMAFVTMKDGSQNLAVLELDTKKLTYLTQFKNGEQIFPPRWAPNGKLIAFSYSSGKGKKLALISADGKQLTLLVDDGKDARDPIFADNSQDIYFSWDRTGVFNIYSINISSKKKAQLTNVLGGAFMPSLSKDGLLIYSEYTSDGFKIAQLDNPRPIELKNAEYYAYEKPTHLASSDNQDVVLINQGIQDQTIHYDDTAAPDLKSNPYTLTYGKISFLPRVMIDYGTTKLGTYFYSSDILDKYDIFGGFAINGDWDYDIFGIINYRKFKPTIFLEVYNKVLHHSEMEDFSPNEIDTISTMFNFRYDLTEVDLGMEFKLNDSQSLRPAFVFNQYRARYQPDYTYQGQEMPAIKYTYYIGKTLQLGWKIGEVYPSSTSDINPAGGRVISIKYNHEFNQFISDFKLTKHGTWTEVFDDYNYSKVELDWKEYIGLFANGKHALNLHVQGGWIDRPTHEFFNFFAGGLIGLRGYPFYSIEGRKMLIGTATYRFPLLNHLDTRLFHLYFDKLYAGIFYDYGNAFNEDELNFADFKGNAGLELRLDMFSFYNFPTKIFFNAAYGFDKHTKIEKYDNTVLEYGQEWRYYLGVSFGYFD